MANPNLNLNPPPHPHPNPNQATTDQNELVALEACEFWSAICETKVARPALGDFLPQLVPVLLKGMVYSEEDIAVLDQVRAKGSGSGSAQG